MPTVHFASDTHFGHRLMTWERGYAPCTPSPDEVRAQQVDAHDEEIIATWDRHVQPEDTVWHLGDLSLISPRRLSGIVPRLNGRIRLVLGNHDRAHPMAGEKSIGALRETLDLGVEWAGAMAVVRIPPTRELARRNGSVPHRVMLSRFPYAADHTDDPRAAQWRLRDESSLLLHGHLHTDMATDPSRPRQVHVGWDARHRPVAAHEIAQIIEHDLPMN